MPTHPRQQRSTHQRQDRRQRPGDRPYPGSDLIDLPVDLGSEQNGKNPATGGVHCCHDRGTSLPRRHRTAQGVFTLFGVWCGINLWN